jgi:hypothetical protein
MLLAQQVLEHGNGLGPAGRVEEDGVHQRGSDRRIVARNQQVARGPPHGGVGGEQIVHRTIEIGRPLRSEDGCDESHCEGKTHEERIKRCDVRSEGWFNESQKPGSGSGSGNVEHGEL